MAKKMPRKTIKWREQGRFEIQFSKETDRAAGVLAGGFLDAVLEDVIREQLAKGKRTEKLFGRDGVLSSFSSKIDMAFALGADELLCSDMDLIRKIRNHFAHPRWGQGEWGEGESHEVASFDKSPVKDWCSRLAVVERTLGTIPGEKMEPRELYLLTVSHLAGRLRNALLHRENVESL